MGVNTNQNDYYEGLFRRTTASYRAKIDKENVEKCRTSDFEKPATSKQAGKQANVKVLYERNHVAASSTSGSSSETQNKLAAKEQRQRNYNARTDKTEFDIRIIKDLIEKELAHLLRENFCQRSTEGSTSAEKTAIKSIVEEVLKEKLIDLRHPSKERINTSQPGSLRPIIEDVVEQILMDKLKSLEKYNNDESMEDLEKDLQRKLNLANGTQKTQQRESLVQRDVNRSFDSQALVEELLDSGEARNKVDKLKTTSNKETTAKPASGIKRLQRSPKRKLEWQDPSQHDNVSEDPHRPQHSPVPTSTARSRRSKCSSSVMSKFNLYFIFTLKIMFFFLLYLSSAFCITGT